MVDWKKIEMPLPDIVKYAVAVVPVVGLLLTLCVQLGLYKGKVDVLIEQNKANSTQLYQQSQDINEIKTVLKIRQSEPPQSYTDSVDPTISKLRPSSPQTSDKFYGGMDIK